MEKARPSRGRPGLRKGGRGQTGLTPVRGVAVILTSLVTIHAATV